MNQRPAGRGGDHSQALTPWAGLRGPARPGVAELRFGCDHCYGVCPDNAVIKLESGTYEFDYDSGKGCGLCVTEGPCGSIEMQPEEG